MHGVSFSGERPRAAAGFSGHSRVILGLFPGFSRVILSNYSRVHGILGWVVLGFGPGCLGWVFLAVDL